MQEDIVNTKETRKAIGDLIISVLTDKIIVREAIKMFPQDVKDASVKCAYHALVHREADEDLRHRDLLYKDEQDSYLEQVARTLQAGNELPKNIIKNYNQYYRNIEINPSGFMQQLIKRLCKILNV